MKSSEKREFIKLMIKVGATYDRAVSSVLMGVYWRILRDFELIDIRYAFKAHCRHPDEGRFFPKPSDIVRLLEGSPESRALIAWTTMEMSMGRVGRYQSVVFEDPLIHAVIEDMGGWIKLCEQSLKELPFTALDFQKRYRAFVTYPPRRHPRYLVGICEGDNTKNGYAIAPPMLIGNQQKAIAVLQSGGGKRLEVQPSTQSVQELIQTIMQVQQQPEGSNDQS